MHRWSPKAPSTTSSSTRRSSGDVTEQTSRLRAYWPGFTKDIEAEVKPCLGCQATADRKHHKDKLNPTEPPEKVWMKVGADQRALMISS